MKFANSFLIVSVALLSDTLVIILLVKLNINKGAQWKRSAPRRPEELPPEKLALEQEGSGGEKRKEAEVEKVPTDKFVADRSKRQRRSVDYRGMDSPCESDDDQVSKSLLLIRGDLTKKLEPFVLSVASQPEVCEGTTRTM